MAARRMVTITHIATVQGSITGAVSRITDMEVLVKNGRTTLWTVDHSGLIVASWNVTGSGQAITFHDSRYFGTSTSYGDDLDMEILPLPTGPTWVLAGLRGIIGKGRIVTDQGNFGNFQQIFPADDLTQDVEQLDMLSFGGNSYILTARHDQTRVSIQKLLPGNDLVATGSVSLPVAAPHPDAEIDGITSFTVNGNAYVATISGLGNYLSLHTVNSNGSFGTSQWVGLQNQSAFLAPRDVEFVETGGRGFLIVSGGRSSTLSVFEVTAQGSLIPRDHILDEATTRFQHATAMCTLEMNGRVFVFVGGSDDGISVFMLDPAGRLIHVQSIADSNMMSLQDITSLKAVAIGGKIALFAAGSGETGITQFEIDPGPIGDTKVAGSGVQNGTGGNDLLIASTATTQLAGGSGDDTLIGGLGDLRMTGGAGRDVFIPGHSPGTVVITDFDIRQDRLDLSELALARSVRDLTIIPTAYGLFIAVEDIRVEIHSHDGRAISPSYLNDTMFPIAHYVNRINWANYTTSSAPIPYSPPGAPSPDQPFGPFGPGPSSGGTFSPKPISSVVFGTPASERLYALPTGSSVLGRGGNDYLGGSISPDSMRGNEGNDTLFGGAGSDTLRGDIGNDLLQGGNGDDLMIGHGGNDRLWGAHGNDVGLGNEGNDLLMGQPGNDRLQGGPGRDTLSGGNGDDTLFGGDGNDILSGHAGDDRLAGNTGANRLQGGPGNDLLTGGIAQDTLSGDAGADWIRGSLGDDVGYGATGNDVLNMGPGNDTAYGQQGNDRISGEGGDDYLDGGNGYNKINGAEGNDTIFGGAQNDTIQGGPGQDKIDGRGGHDTLAGGSGNDRITARGGNDTIDGGSGNDVIQTGDGANKAFGREGNDTINGGFHGDTLEGGNGNDRLIGRGGRDSLVGGSGADYLDGGDEIDQLRGGSGRDTLIGAGGDDHIVGGLDADTLTGGPGADTFVFTRAIESSVATSDTITDFQAGQDKLDLSAFDGLIWYDRADYDGTPGIRLEYGGAQRTIVLVDLDGDMESDIRIVVDGAANLDPLDFIWS